MRYCVVYSSKVCHVYHKGILFKRFVSYHLQNKMLSTRVAHYLWSLTVCCNAVGKWFLFTQSVWLNTRWRRYIQYQVYLTFINESTRKWILSSCETLISITVFLSGPQPLRKFGFQFCFSKHFMFLGKIYRYELQRV